MPVAERGALARAQSFYELVRRRAPAAHRVLRTMSRVAVRALSAVKRFALPPDTPYAYRFLLDRYEPGTTNLLKRHVRAGMKVADVGAHIGYHTRIFAKRVGETGTVYAFEPNPDTFKLLRRNTSASRNVRLFEAAALDAERTVTFHQAADSGASSLWAANTRGTPTGSVSVRATSLDKALGDVALDLVKIDAEGAEPEVLDGMREVLGRSRNPTLVVECYPPALEGRGATAEMLFGQLRELGFDISAIEEEAGGLVALPAYASLERLLADGPKYVNLWCTRAGSEGRVTPTS